MLPPRPPPPSPPAPLPHRSQIQRGQLPAPADPEEERMLLHMAEFQVDIHAQENRAAIASRDRSQAELEAVQLRLDSYRRERERRNDRERSRSPRKKRWVSRLQFFRTSLGLFVALRFPSLCYCEARYSSLAEGRVSLISFDYFLASSSIESHVDHIMSISLQLQKGQPEWIFKYKSSKRKRQGPTASDRESGRSMSLILRAGRVQISIQKYIPPL